MARGQVQVGMTYDMLIAAWGNPVEVNTTQLPGGHTNLQLIYNNPPHSGVADLFKSLICSGCIYVYVEDGRITEIQN